MMSNTNRMTVNAATAIYNRCYMELKSQQTVLMSLESRVSKVADDIPWRQKKTFNDISNDLQQLIRCDYSKLMSTAEQFISTNKYLGTKDEEFNKVSKIFRTAAYSITRIALELNYNAFHRSEETSYDINGTVNQPTSEGRCVVCRICNEQIPIQFFEDHSRSCLQTYQNAEKLMQIDQSILKMKNKIASKKLKTFWPGIQNFVVLNVFPILHIFLLLETTGNFNPHENEYTDLLTYMRIAIDAFPLIPGISKLIHKAQDIIREKIKISFAIIESATILKQTIGRQISPHNAIRVTIRDFDFIKKISSGAFASVFLAKKRQTGDIFAIKVTPKTKLTQKNEVRRIMSEKDILLNFSNPYIVKFYFSIIGNRNLYLVTEFVPGGDLYSLLSKVGSFDEDTAKIYTLQILNAMKYLRENGIIHRDIKPDNILVAVDGKLKLTDFGLSYMGMVDRHLANEGVQDNSIVGTPDYIAPEILLNRPHSFAVDYWSLGVMIYEFLIGTPPFHGSTETETNMNILSGYYEYEEDVELSDEAKDLISKLLILNPEHRLGAKNIEEIINHQWFKGINIETATPPFIPELTSTTDTDYFEQRYTFSVGNESDILEDIGCCEIEDSTDDDIKDFPSVAVHQLDEANKEVVKQIHIDNSKSVDSLRDRISVSFTNSAVPKPRESVQRRRINSNMKVTSTSYLNKELISALQKTEKKK